MAQQFQQKQPNRGERKDDNYADDEGWQPSIPDSSHLDNLNKGNNQVLSDIDRVLADNDALRSGSSDTASSLADQENAGAGYYRPEKDKTAVDKDSLAKSESAAGSDSDGLYTPDDKRARRSFRFNRRQGIAGTLIGLLLGGGFFGFGLVSQAAMPVEASHILQRAFYKNNSDSSNRFGHLFRNAGNLSSDEVASSRLASLGTAVFGNPLSQLRDIGITFDRGLSGAPTRTNFDIKRLKTAYPELDGKTDAQVKSFLSEKLSIPDTAFGGKSGSFFIDESTLKTAGYETYNVKTSRFLTQNTLSLLDDGSAITGVKFRYLTKIFNLPSAFHPLERKFADKINQLPANQRPSAAAEEETQRTAALDAEANLVPTVEEKTGAEAEADIEGKSSGVDSVIKAMDVQAGACFARDIAAEIPAIDRGRVVLPAVIRDIDLVATGEQIQAGGSDVTGEEVGAVTAGLYDASGKSIFAGRAFQALAGDGTASTGPDISPDYKQAFTSHDTANKVVRYADDALGGKASSAVLCNPLVLITEAGVQLIASAAATLSGQEELTAAIVAGWAANATRQVVGTTIFMHWLQNFVINKTTAKALAAKAFSGPTGGNLLAYGARAAGNIVGLASGGVDLGATASTLVDAQQSQQDTQQFRSESFSDRLFAVNDYRSLAGRTSQSMSPTVTQNASNLASGMLNVGSLLTHAFSNLFPKAVAASSQPYDWGFSQVGLPDSLLNDPALSDPYASAQALIPVLQADTGGVIERAYHCFGDQITNNNSDHVWDVVRVTTVDTNSEDYISNNCNPFNGATASVDMNWARVVMFVYDTNNIKAAACYQINSLTCSEIGAGS